MMKSSFVHRPDQVTSAWLSSVLDRRVEVTGTNPIGTGQVGQNVQVSLKASEDLPASLVLKCVSENPVSRQTGVQTLAYLREVVFYNELSSMTEVEIPEIYFASIDNDSHDFVIVMEDLSPALQGDQITGCSADDAAKALEQLARLHGPTMVNGQLRNHRLFTPTTPVTEQDGTQALFDAVKEGFLARYSDSLTETHRQLMTDIGPLIPTYNRRYGGPPALLHGDFRLDNLMFGGRRPITVIDWQSIGLGCPLQDAAYFLGSSLSPEDRAKHESELIRHYFDHLQRYQVGLSFDDCWYYYRHFAPAALILAVIASMLMEETDRGNDMILAVFNRSAAMCEELGVLELIRGAV